jgi:hypothetical protein
MKKHVPEQINDKLMELAGAFITAHEEGLTASIMQAQAKAASTKKPAV